MDLDKTNSTLKKEYKKFQDKDKTGWGALAAGGLLTASGLSLVPAAISFRKSTKALAAAGGPKGLRDQGAADVVSNYIRGGRRFGKSLPGRIFRGANAQIDRISKAIDEGNATVVDRVLNEGVRRAKIKSTDFSRLHMQKFTESNPKKAFDFWLGVEALGKSKGQFEQVSRKVLDNLNARELYPNSVGKTDSELLSDLINYKLIGKKQLNKKHMVPTYNRSGAQFVTKPLNKLHESYTRDQASIRNLQEGIFRETKGRGSNLYKAIKDVDTFGTPDQKRTIWRMATEKANDGYPQHYYKQTSLGAAGFTGAGSVGVAYGLGKRDKKS